MKPPVSAEEIAGTRFARKSAKTVIVVFSRGRTSLRGKFGSWLNILAAKVGGDVRVLTLTLREGEQVQVSSILGGLTTGFCIGYDASEGSTNSIYPPAGVE